LHWDALVDADLIEVDVADGKVLLSGVVGSAAEKDQAVMDAWVKGVQAVTAEGLKIRDWARDRQQRSDVFVVKSDKEIRRAVEDALFYDPRLSPFDISVAVEGGFVTLRGSVDHLKAKRAAERDALNTVGVHGVTNRIRIQSQPPPSTDIIADKVREALQRDPIVDRFEMIVTVIDQTAYLDGTVDTYFEKAQADEVVSRVRGVVRVKNNLQVRDKRDPYVHDPYVEDWTVFEPEWYDYAPGRTFKSDGQIREDIRDELFWSPFVDENQVEVAVDDGVATLRGTVDSRAERATAEANAFDGGAVWVVNQIEVR
jgi:osmotically-inducible protein OsmY